MNPMQIISQIMGNKMAQNNPIMGNAISMYQNGDENGLQNLATNLCKERGIDIDKLKNQIMGSLRG